MSLTPTVAAHPHTRTHTRPHDHGAGFSLVEVVVVIALVGIVAVPLSGLVVTLLRVIVTTERTATRTALVVTGSSLAARLALPDPCAPGALSALVADRAGVPTGYDLVVVVDCTDPLVVVVEVTATDPSGTSSTLVVIRPER